MVGKKLRLSKHKEQLPDFSRMTHEEIAEFWDTHSFTDYWDEMEEIDVTVRRRPIAVVSLRLEQEDLARIKKIARGMGVGYSALLRIWVKEKLRELQLANNRVPRLHVCALGGSGVMGVTVGP